MPKQTLAYCLLLIVLQLFTGPVNAAGWRELAPGIEYQDLGINILTLWSHIHTFRIDLKSNKLDLVMAQDLSRHLASADEFAQHSNALIATNGGFFDQNNQPLGLRISNQQQQSPIKRISWWGIFYIHNQKASIASPFQYLNNDHVNFAVQSGPRLIINGEIPSLKPGYAERTALGITRDGRVILIVTEKTPMTTASLASLMRAPPLNCIDALNLDGGSSSQLSAHIGAFNINDRGFSNVSDAIIVKPNKMTGKR